MCPNCHQKAHDHALQVKIDLIARRNAKALLMDKVFALSLENCDVIKEEQTADSPQNVLDLAQKRADAKKQKDYIKRDIGNISKDKRT